MDAGRPPGGRAVHHPPHLPPPRWRHHRVVVAGPSQACLAALPRRIRARAHLVGAGAGVVVDRGPLRRRVHLLPDRPVPGVRGARRVGRRRDGVLRRLGLLHLGGCAPVPRDLQRRPWTGRRAPAAAPPARLRATADRLVEQCASVRRHAVVQPGHLPGDADGARAADIRPAGLETRRSRLGMLPRLGLSGRTSRSAAVSRAGPAAASRGGSQPSTSPDASPSGSRPSPPMSSPRPEASSTWPPPTPSRHSVPCASWSAPCSCCPSPPRRPPHDKPASHPSGRDGPELHPQEGRRALPDRTLDAKPTAAHVA